MTLHEIRDSIFQHYKISNFVNSTLNASSSEMVRIIIKWLSANSMIGKPLLRLGDVSINVTASDINKPSLMIEAVFLL
jgi:hypothetical protein